MANTDTDFEEEIFEEFEEEEPAPRKTAVSPPPKKANTPTLGKKIAPAQNPAQAPAPARVAPVESTAPEVPAQKRYNLYAIPHRTGLFDTVENRPSIEADNDNALILAMLEEILNRLNQLEERI